MLSNLLKISVQAPAKWQDCEERAPSTLHQLSPYIGKLKPPIARYLVSRYTKPGDVILDCFAGSGTVPLEGKIQGRHVIGCDCSPYSVTLTRGKLEAPESHEEAVEMIESRLASANKRPRYSIDTIPDWVKKFFHPETLQDTLRFADECVEKDDQFLLSCLLGILHHQRPGFLSYPSSHLVPYLRDKSFPRENFPEMYERRFLEPRLIAKARRALKLGNHRSTGMISEVFQIDIGNLDLDRKVDSIITSPPYMNALDYVRDNRLRLWFLDRQTNKDSKEPTDKKAQFDLLSKNFAKNALSKLRKGGNCILVIGETVTRSQKTSHPAEVMLGHILEAVPSISLDHVIEDEIPDIRRSRRNTSGTKREFILVLKKG